MSAQLIKRFGREIIIRTYDAGSYVNGKWVEGAEIVLSNIIASIQQLSPKEVLLLPEGDRQKEWRKVYSTYQFKVKKDGTMEQSDLVTIDGNDFQVMKVQDYTMHERLGIRYYRADVCFDNTPNT
jgi:hypothetical protein